MKKLFRTAFATLLVLPMVCFAAGAIAVDDEEGETDPGYGVITGAKSREEASRQALAECRKHGNKECKVVVRFDKCGAYAGSKKYFGVGWGNTLQAAQKKALEECGQGSCKVLVAECE
jgi:hypothetical protein